MPRNRAAEETSFRKRGNDVKRTFQKGAALALAALWFPVAFLALAETPKEALDRLKEEKNRLEEQIEQAEQRQEDAATMKELYLQKANSILAQLDVLNEQIRQQKAQVDQANQALAAAQRQVEAGREAFEQRLVAMYETRNQSACRLCWVSATLPK